MRVFDSFEEYMEARRVGFERPTPIKEEHEVQVEEVPESPAEPEEAPEAE